MQNYVLYMYRMMHSIYLFHYLLINHPLPQFLFSCYSFLNWLQFYDIFLILNFPEMYVMLLLVQLLSGQVYTKAVRLTKRPVRTPVWQRSCSMPHWPILVGLIFSKGTNRMEAAEKEEQRKEAVRMSGTQKKNRIRKQILLMTKSLAIWRIF